MSEGDTPVGDIGENAARAGSEVDSYMVPLPGGKVGIIAQAKGAVGQFIQLTTKEAAEFIGRFRTAGGQVKTKDND